MSDDQQNNEPMISPQEAQELIKKAHANPGDAETNAKAIELLISYSIGALDSGDGETFQKMLGTAAGLLEAAVESNPEDELLLQAKAQFEELIGTLQEAEDVDMPSSPEEMQALIVKASENPDDAELNAKVADLMIRNAVGAIQAGNQEAFQQSMDISATLLATSLEKSPESPVLLKVKGQFDEFVAQLREQGEASANAAMEAYEKDPTNLQNAGEAAMVTASKAMHANETGKREEADELLAKAKSIINRSMLMNPDHPKMLEIKKKIDSVKF